MTDNRISRRRLIELGLGAATTAGVSATGIRLAHAAGGESPSLMREGRGRDSAVDRSYTFLDTMMDAYAHDATLRLSQSFTDQQGLLSTGFTYDNAQLTLAYLVRGRNDDLSRARVIGDSFLYAQANDPNFTDGRLRQAYFVDQPDANGVFLRLALAPFFFIGSAVGDMAWAGIALAQLHKRTRDGKYLDGAVKLANWIQNIASDTRGAGGYNFGVDGGNNLLTFKSTEHNISAHGLFSLLAELTRDPVWSSRAEHARNFLAAMFNSEDGFFWTGTAPDGVTINRDNIPEDTQTWSFMTLLDDDFARSIDWCKTNLATTDTPQTINSRLSGNLRIQGTTFASQSLRSLGPSSQFDPPPDPNGVWLEGTGHLAAALLVRKLSRSRDIDGFDGDQETARVLLENIELAQDRLGLDQTVGGQPIPNGQGVVAASSVVNTGFGFSFFPNRHLAATSWYLQAAQSANAFQPGFK